MYSTSDFGFCERINTIFTQSKVHILLTLEGTLPLIITRTGFHPGTIHNNYLSSNTVIFSLLNSFQVHKETF